MSIASMPDVPPSEQGSKEEEVQEVQAEFTTYQHNISPMLQCQKVGRLTVKEVEELLDQYFLFYESRDILDVEINLKTPKIKVFRLEDKIVLDMCDMSFPLLPRELSYELDSLQTVLNYLPFNLSEFVLVDRQIAQTTLLTSYDELPEEEKKLVRLVEALQGRDMSDFTGLIPFTPDQIN